MSLKPNIGDKFGSWTVLAPCGYGQKYKCKCICGTEANVRQYDLTKRKSTCCKSCASSSKSSLPLMSDSDTYNIWVHICQRTGNPKSKDYMNYGGRGITMDPLWRSSYPAFLMAVGARPTVYHSIDRIDVNGNYEPGNVRWSTMAEQSVNKRSTLYVTINGITKAVSEWASDPTVKTVSAKLAYKRIERGMPAYEALTTPVRQKPIKKS